MSIYRDNILGNSVLDTVIFGVYEILSNIFPGALLLVTIILFLININTTFLSKYNYEIFSDNIIFLIFLFISFILGQIIQSISSIWEKIYYKKVFHGYPSEKILSEGDHTFPPYFKEEIRKKINNEYGVPNESSSQHIFEICYTYVVENNLSNRVTNFLNMYTFSRNMIITSLIEGLLLVTWSFLKSDINIRLIGIIFLCTVLPFFERYQNYAKAFAKEVFRSYFIGKKVK